MGISDKISNKVDDVAGKAKEGVGRASGDKSTEKNEGKLDQQVQPQGRRREGQRRLQELMELRNEPPATPVDARKASEEQRVLQDQLDHQNDDPAGPGKVDTDQIADESTR